MTQEAPSTPLTARALHGFVAARSLSFLADVTKGVYHPRTRLRELTRSAAMSGVALAVEYGPKIVLVPLLGAWSQRFALRPQFIFVEALRAGLCVTLVFAPNVVTIMVVAALIAVLGSYAYVLNESLVATATSGPARTTTQARLQAADQLARVGGPAIGAAVYGLIGSRWITAGAGALFLLCGLSLYALPKTTDRRAPAAAGRTRGVRYGLSVFLRSPELIRLTALLCAVNFAGGVLIAIAPALIVETFSRPLSSFGLLSSVAAALSIGVMGFVGRGASHGAGPALGHWGLIGVLVALVVVSIAPNFPIFVAGYSLFAAGASPSPPTSASSGSASFRRTRSARRSE